MAKAKIHQITIKRIEGSDGEYGMDGPIVVHSWEDASKCLSNIARTAPADGCYDKTEFQVDWKNGESYTGRADVMREHINGYDLGAQILAFLSMVAGIKAPSGWSPARFAAFQAGQNPAQKRNAKRMIDTCEIVSVPRAAPVEMPPDKNPEAVKAALTRADPRSALVWRFSEGIQPRPEPFPATVDVTLDDVCAALGIPAATAVRSVPVANGVTGYAQKADSRFRN